jgi:putative membrane protein
MTWWCSAQGIPWDWTWRPYPGVWLFIGVLVAGYIAALQRWRPDPLVGDQDSLQRAHIASFSAGILVLWIAADWPVGALGAGYLVSLHTLQYLLFALVAPPLLLQGIPRWVLREILRTRWIGMLARGLSRPLLAFVVFNVAMLGTHLPAVVDGLGGSQFGSFGMDMAWLVSGIAFWWPVMGLLPEPHHLSYPARIVYLILNVFIPTVPAAFLTFADYPIYSLYELAPPVHGISATTDQQLAGLTMKVVGGLIIFGTASVLFFRWHRREDDGTTQSLVIPSLRPGL